MPVKDVVIRAQELGGRWVSLGSDSARGIVVEDLVCDSDTGGSRSCSFTLRRDPRVPWPDIGAFAPLEVESQGLPFWSGRVKGTPTTDGTDRRITVNGEGWQYHLDDDAYQSLYVDSDLSHWSDRRGIPTTVLGPGAHVAIGQVSANGGSITLQFPPTTPAVGDQCGVIFDAGPNSSVARWTLGYQTSANSLNHFLTMYAGPDPSGSAATTVLNQTLTAWGAAGGTSQTTPAGSRYLFAVLAFNGVVAAYGEVWVKIITSIEYVNAAYESSNASILKASDVVKDARSRATLLLSSDTSKIATTSFNIPDFNMTKPDTPRNVINAANAYHNYQARVTVDKLLEYRPLPANASIQVDARSEFDEASAGDASEIYSTCIVTYTGPDGVAASVTRSQPASLYVVSAIQPTNPGAEVDTTGWVASTGATLTRTAVAGEFSAGVAGFKVVDVAPGTANASTTAFSGGSFVPGQGYHLTFDLRTTANENCRVSVVVDGVAISSVQLNGTGSFVTGISIDWIQTSSSTPQLVFAGSSVLSAAMTFFFDNLILYTAAPTIVNRRGFRRTYSLDTNMSLTPTAAAQIADAFLAAHKTTPFKGKLTLTGYGLANKTPSGVRMPACELLLNTGELIRFPQLVDPDTGAVGREGRIASASWDASSDTTTIEIDSTVTNFESLLARLGILTGQVK